MRNILNNISTYFSNIEYNKILEKCRVGYLDCVVFIKAILSGQTRIFDKFNAILHDLSLINTMLGIDHLMSGQLDDAALRFKFAIFFGKFWKFDKCTYYYLGRTYQQKLKIKEAQKYFSAYIESKDEKFKKETEFCLNEIDGNYKNIQGIPLSLVIIKFEQVAEKYDEMFGVSESTSPQNILFAMLNEYVSASIKPYANKILDLGCGTGYIGEAIKQAKMSANLVGVDACGSMTRIAKIRKVDGVSAYSDVQHKSIRDYISEHYVNKYSKFDIVILSNVLNYFYNIEELFEALTEIVENGGVLCISLKTSSDKENAIEFSGIEEEYYFSFDYLISCAEKYSFKVQESKDIKYLDNDDGNALLLIKNA